MIEYVFILNPDSDNITIEHPIGFADEFELSVKRDDKSHGMSFEASTGSIGFHGSSAVDFLREQKRLYGQKASVIFQAKARCEGEEEYTEIVRGKLNFGKWSESCGTECIIKLPIEEDSCVVTLHSRWDQKVDIDNAKGFDGYTSLPSYAGLGLDMELPAKELQAAIDGQVAEAGDVVEFSIAAINNSQTFVRPTYEVERYNNIATGILIPTSDWESTDNDVDSPISPFFLYEDTPTCFDGEFAYSFRMKGSYSLDPTFVAGSGSLTTLSLKLLRWDGTGDIFTSAFIMNNVNIPFTGNFPSTVTGTFDETLAFAEPFDPGIAFYAVLEIVTTGTSTYRVDVIITWDKETSGRVEAVKSCPSSNTDAYLIHETISRATEALTDYCVRVKSSYYGRTDSEPFSFDADGCGSLRFVTSGLKIRRAIEDKFFISPKDLMEGLQAIDNIGWGVEPDPERLNKHLLIIEALDYFYQNTEIFRCPFIPKADINVEESRHYSKIEAGYKNWEVESINGLDEFNSTREYRTSLNSISNTLDIVSNFIAGSYPIEVTRQLSFADSGGADSKYDNEAFIICLRRMLYGFEVEQGNITNGENIFSPDTTYNFRISPLRNLMRWYRSIVSSYPNISDSDNKLFFSAGTGNLVAKGEMTSSFCKLENQAIKENQDLFTTHFEDQQQATPLWVNETVTFEYPLSVSDYTAIKSNPYGYVSFQCGQGDFEKGFIKELKYKLNAGKATFILRKKWQ